MPKFKTARYAHSCCVLQSKLYAFGGLKANSFLDTIECLDLEGGKKWDSFRTPAFSARWNTAVAPINLNEMVIMGGRHEGGFHSQVLIFNVQTRRARHAIYHGDFRFDCKSPATMTKQGTVIALVDTINELKLVSYNAVSN
mmetsp:Transcript_32753/g.40533  ORF Transcript_32753/g.40533 Transcript_32753/m.40533 type:complete len:141 (-) Transcript_32753:102-524(-)